VSYTTYDEYYVPNVLCGKSVRVCIAQDKTRPAFIVNATDVNTADLVLMCSGTDDNADLTTLGWANVSDANVPLVRATNVVRGHGVGQWWE